MTEEEPQNNFRIEYEGNVVWAVDTRDGITVRERVPRHVLKMSEEAALVHIDPICKRLAERLQFECELAKTKVEVDGSNEKLAADWRNDNTIKSAHDLLWAILGIPLMLRGLFKRDLPDKP